MQSNPVARMKTTLVALLFVASALAPAVSAVDRPQPSNPDYIPCRVHRNTAAVFPIRLLEQGIIRGEATVIIEVDGTGQIVDQLVTAYTHPDFAEQATSAIKDWTFEAGRHKDLPVVSVVTINFEFSVNSIVVYERRFDSIRLDEYLANRYAYFAHGSATLDEKPVVLSASPPVYPREWANEGRHGSVIVRFYIDESGRARLPIVTEKADDFLASAAAAAVKQWKFKPPTQGGKPVLAYAEQVFVFEPPPPTDTKS